MIEYKRHYKIEPTWRNQDWVMEKAREAEDGSFPRETERTKPYKPDVMHFDAFPARAGYMMLAGCTLGREELLNLYDSLPVESTDEEARRNIAARQPMLWMV